MSLLSHLLVSRAATLHAVQEWRAGMAQGWGGLVRAPNLKPLRGHLFRIKETFIQIVNCVLLKI